MFRYIWRKLKLVKMINQLPPIHGETLQPPHQPEVHSAISKALQNNLAQIKAIIHHSTDVVIREFSIGNGRIAAFIISLEGMSEYPLINEGILSPLMRQIEKESPTEITIEYLKNSAIKINGINEATTMEEVVGAVLQGNTAFFMDGSDIALIIKTRTWEHRGVQQPQTDLFLSARRRLGPMVKYERL